MKHILAVACVGILALTGYYLLRISHPAVSEPQNTDSAGAITITEDSSVPTGFPDAAQMPANNTQVVDAVGPPRTPPSGSKEYHNSQYHFSVFYPKNLSTHEKDEGKGAITITFEDVKNAQGFQVFVLPYGERQVSAQRFKQDEPSGALKDPLQIQIDGATGTAFTSKDTLLGDTREVWFIHNGYLFEITAPFSLDSWLAEIMKSWKFI